MQISAAMYHHFRGIVRIHPGEDYNSAGLPDLLSLSNESVSFRVRAFGKWQCGIGWLVKND